MVEHRQSVIGSTENFWLYNAADESFDLTHPPSPNSEPILPRVPIETTTAKIWVDPSKTALVVIDMQNFFLSPALGRSPDGNGVKAANKLLKHAIPACRKAAIPIIWLNWGLTQQEIDEMPPATLRAFGFKGVPQESKANGEADDHSTNNDENLATDLPPKAAFGKDPRVYKGLGSHIGRIELEDGTVVDAGRLLMRDQWNSELYPPLEKARKDSDLWIHKNRMSGLWGPGTDCTQYLESHGIRTLLFAGVNTDQCVAGSLQDAFTKGWDCLLLSDGSGTTSPSYAQDCVEFNSAKSWGFVIRCEDLARGVENMQTA